MQGRDAGPGDVKAGEGGVARLALWNRIFHGIPVAVAELDAARVRGDPERLEDCAAYVLLRACTVVATEARLAVRQTLRIAILYWFSNVGERRGEERASLAPRRNAFHLGEAIGTGMTWDEAVAAMNRKPIDYAAYLRVLEMVHEEYATQWQIQFPGRAPVALASLGVFVREPQVARGLDSLPPRREAT